MEKRISSPRRLSGSITVPPDKSISHRAAILNAIAAGSAVVENFLAGGRLPCHPRLSALPRRLLVAPGERRWSSRPVDRPAAGSTACARAPTSSTPATPARRCGSSPVFSPAVPSSRSSPATSRSAPGPWRASSSPCGRWALRSAGATATPWRRLPSPAGRFAASDYRSPVASAQVKSAVLLAGLQAEGETRLRGTGALPRPHGAHAAGHGRRSRPKRAMPSACRRSRQDLTPLSLRVPGDFSAAAFWLVAAALHPDAEIALSGVGVNPTRTGLLDVLREMGADIAVSQRTCRRRRAGRRPPCASEQLRGDDVEGSLVVRLIDEVPVLAVAASLAEGRTIIRDVGELRLKESDRVKLTVQELRRMGARIDEEGDALVIEGSGRLKGADLRKPRRPPSGDGARRRRPRRRRRNGYQRRGGRRRLLSRFLARPRSRRWNEMTGRCGDGR